MWVRRLLWADGGTLALALETKGRGCWPRTMAASVCLFVCVSGYRLREPRLPCIADVRVSVWSVDWEAGRSGAGLRTVRAVRVDGLRVYACLAAGAFQYTAGTCTTKLHAGCMSTGCTSIACIPIGADSRRLHSTCSSTIDRTLTPQPQVSVVDYEK